MRLNPRGPDEIIAGVYLQMYHKLRNPLPSALHSPLTTHSPLQLTATMPRTAARRYRHFEPANSSTPKLSKSSSAEPHASAEPPHLPANYAPHLPTEILLHILSFIPPRRTSQATLASFCLVSRAWYAAATTRLYEKPSIHGKNFDPFVRTVCPSINAHVRKSELAELVKVLDLGSLVHHGSKSVTARLLGRTKANLHTFVAPQASFGLNCLAALSKCQQLRVLDLGLISESIGLQDLIHALAKLGTLTTLAFPRCSLSRSGFYPQSTSWPPQLASLTLSGGVDNEIVYRVANLDGCKLPPSLTKLSLTHCTAVMPSTTLELIRSLRDQLVTLHITNMPRFGVGNMNTVLYDLPNVFQLTISLDYLSYSAFTSTPEPQIEERRIYPLRSLKLVSSGNPSPADFGYRPGDLELNISRGFFPFLHDVCVAKSCGWNKGSNADELPSLAETVEEQDDENRKARRGVYAGLSDEEVARMPAGGVWEIKE